MLPFEQLQKDIEAIQAKLIKEIDAMLASGKSKQEIAVFIDSTNFDELLDDYGASDAVRKYVTGLDSVVKDVAKDLSDNVANSLELIQNKQSEYILGNLSNRMVLWQSSMVEGLISGVKDADILKQLQTIGLTDSQAGSVLQTSYYNFSRATTAAVYEDDPDQKFRYAGGTIPTSSPQCRWLFKNQKSEGYTKAEIDRGIETPFGIINFFGRIPNYNCIHTWKAIR